MPATRTCCACLRSVATGYLCGTTACGSTSCASTAPRCAVCATHADQTLRMIADADEPERAVLSAVRYAANEAVLHTDASLMPRRRRAWCAWNYVADEDGICDRRVGVSYWMNQLQQLPGTTPYVVTLNPPRE